MLTVTLHKFGVAPEKDWTRVGVVSRYNNKWIFCKHKQRDTWEILGGHIEEGEDWLTAVKRELYE